MKFAQFIEALQDKGEDFKVKTDGEIATVYLTTIEINDFTVSFNMKSGLPDKLEICGMDFQLL